VTGMSIIILVISYSNSSLTDISNISTGRTLHKEQQ
jgi:hypothetical protein